MSAAAATHDGARAFGHVVVVGGTGMLRAATLALAARARELTCVGRRRRALEEIGRVAAELGTAYHALRLDWTERARFVAELCAHVRRTRPADLLVAWCHDEGLAGRLALVVPLTADARCVTIAGSAAADPSRPARGDVPPPESHHVRVVLGFVREATRSRWLTHAEICAGVLAALESDAAEHVVGVVRPWSERP